ncbi:MAG: hypothetical protein WCP58_01470 [bacterium]
MDGFETRPYEDHSGVNHTPETAAPQCGKSGIWTAPGTIGFPGTETALGTIGFPGTIIGIIAG